MDAYVTRHLFLEERPKPDVVEQHLTYVARGRATRGQIRRGDFGWLDVEAGALAGFHRECGSRALSTIPTDVDFNLNRKREWEAVIRGVRLTAAEHNRRYREKQAAEGKRLANEALERERIAKEKHEKRQVEYKAELERISRRQREEAERLFADGPGPLWHIPNPPMSACFVEPILPTFEFQKPGGLTPLAEAMKGLERHQDRIDAEMARHRKTVEDMVRAEMERQRKMAQWYDGAAYRDARQDIVDGKWGYTYTPATQSDEELTFDTETNAGIHLDELAKRRAAEREAKAKASPVRVVGFHDLAVDVLICRGREDAAKWIKKFPGRWNDQRLVVIGEPLDLKPIRGVYATDDAVVTTGIAHTVKAIRARQAEQDPHLFWEPAQLNLNVAEPDVLDKAAEALAAEPDLAPFQRKFLDDWIGAERPHRLAVVQFHQEKYLRGSDEHLADFVARFLPPLIRTVGNGRFEYVETPPEGTVVTGDKS